VAGNFDEMIVFDLSALRISPGSPKLHAELARR
jgi:hypothetical protein